MRGCSWQRNSGRTSASVPHAQHAKRNEPSEQTQNAQVSNYPSLTGLSYRDRLDVVVSSPLVGTTAAAAVTVLDENPRNGSMEDVKVVVAGGGGGDGGTASSVDAGGGLVPSDGARLPNKRRIIYPSLC
jgi:hypothetical protein